MTKSAAFFCDPRSRQLAALYADSQLEEGNYESKAILRSEKVVSSPIYYLIQSPIKKSRVVRPFLVVTDFASVIECPR
jgi:hypothetical protein